MSKNLKKILVAGASLLLMASVGAGVSCIKANAKIVDGVHIANNIPNSALRRGGEYHQEFEFDLAKLHQRKHHGRRHSVKRHRNRRAKRYARKHKQARKAKRTKGFYFSNVWSAALKHNQKGLKFAKKNHNYRLIKNIKQAIKHDKKMLKMSARFSPKSQAKQRKFAAERDNAYENKVAAQTLAQER